MTVPEQKLADVAKVPFWYHSIDLGDGVITPGRRSIVEQDERSAKIPLPLKDKNVLDIGAWEGYFSFWCEKQGAKVTAIDNFQHLPFVRSKYKKKLKAGQGFEVAKRWLRSKVKLIDGNYTQLKGSYDVVLYMGVLYHEKNPLLALEHLFRLTSKCAVIETHYVPGKEPVMKFYQGITLNMDPTCYWGPTLSCIEQMLHEVGFKKIELVSKFGHRDLRVTYRAWK